jgi:hypothetical protein
MSPDLDRALCDRYPLIFADRHAPESQTAMCQGFDCEDGWYFLVDVLCRELQWMTDHAEAPQVIALQVKQKFGGLRFYVRGASEDQRAMIRLAHALSLRMCEICGTPVQLDEGPKAGWATRCAEHRA